MPLIALLAEHPNTKQLTAFTRRIRRNYFDGLWAKDENNVDTRRGQNKMDWSDLIQIINQVEDKDLLNIENEKITFPKKSVTFLYGMTRMSKSRTNFVRNTLKP